MAYENSLQARFGAAADRREHEYQRLTKEEKDALAEAMEAIRAEGEAEKERLRQEQQARREDDLERERRKILIDKQQSTYRPWWAEGAYRLTEERVNQLAERAVESENARQLSEIDARSEKLVASRIDEALGAHPEFQRERESVDLMKARWSETRDATRYEGHEDTPGRDQDPRDRGRGR